jgi:surfeit locus 1 family protein
MMRFRPQLVPTLIFIPMLLLILVLGIWQLQRLEWKTARITEIQAELSEEPKAFDASMANLAPYQFRHVLLKGHFLHEKELRRAARYHKGSLGYEILTPLVLETGETLLINRGWVPQSFEDPSTRTETFVQGEQEIRAVLHTPSKKGLFTPENNAERNLWFWFDMPAMQQATGLALLPLVADAIAPQVKGQLPIPATGKIELRNDHLMYAITWFLMALGLVVVYLLYHRKEGRL